MHVIGLINVVLVCFVNDVIVIVFSETFVFIDAQRTIRRISQYVTSGDLAQPSAKVVVHAENFALNMYLVASMHAVREEEQGKNWLHPRACCEMSCYGNAGHPSGSDVKLLQCIGPYQCHGIIPTMGL